MILLRSLGLLEVAKFILASSGNFLDDDLTTRNIQVQLTQETDIQEIQQWRLSGFDSNPSPEVKGLIVDLGDGYKISIAEKDGLTDSGLNPGERKIYSDLAGTEMAALVLKNTGQVSLGTSTAELLTILDDTLTDVITALEFVRDTMTFTNGGGPTGPPTNGAVLTPTIVTLEATQTLLGTIKI